MIEADLIRPAPVLFHMAELEAWPSIQKLGLLSTTSLAHSLPIPEQERSKIISELEL